MSRYATQSSAKHDLYESLSTGVSGVAERVIVGLNWTLVVGPDGAGLAQTPARGTAGCRSLPRPGTYAEQALVTLAALWKSDNIFERTIAVAAVNAHWNRYNIDASAANGLDLIENRGERTVVIGRFPGVADRPGGQSRRDRGRKAPGCGPQVRRPSFLERVMDQTHTLTPCRSP